MSVLCGADPLRGLRVQALRKGRSAFRIAPRKSVDAAARTTLAPLPSRSLGSTSITWRMPLVMSWSYLPPMWCRTVRAAAVAHNHICLARRYFRHWYHRTRTGRQDSKSPILRDIRVRVSSRVLHRTEVKLPRSQRNNARPFAMRTGARCYLNRRRGSERLAAHQLDPAVRGASLGRGVRCGGPQLVADRRRARASSVLE